jgi:hypothetical protein
MNILFGDPFYHNIIYHLHIKDLYNLMSTCKHLKNSVSHHINEIMRFKLKMTSIKNVAMIMNFLKIKLKSY